MAIKREKEIKSNSSEATAKRKRRIVSIIGLLIFFALSAAVAMPLIKFFKKPAMFQQWVAGFGMWSWLICIGAMALQIIIAIIPGGAMEIGAGYAFGAVEATILCTIGSMVGCAIVFWFVRVFGVKVVESFFSIEKIQNLKFLHDEKKRDILSFIIFLIPGMPKDLISYFMGLTDIKLSRWLLISTVARIPAIVVSAMGGQALGKGQYLVAVIVLAVILGVSIIGTVAYKILCNYHNKKSKQH
jgi:uncharacterized membrane protein YdjX (TVP38/TMEM64 family)